MTTLEGCLYAVRPLHPQIPSKVGVVPGKTEELEGLGQHQLQGMHEDPGKLEIIWQRPLPTPVLSTPGVDETHGLLIVVLLDGSACAFSHQGWPLVPHLQYSSLH